jgi:hypothetical protein
VPGGHASGSLTALLLANPVDSARVWAIALLQADTLAGPMGAALKKVLGPSGTWLIFAALLGWVAIPLAGAGRRFARASL